MTAVQSGSELYYDPYDFELHLDPYPVFKRLREEKPLYYNEKYDFYALSRYADVAQAFNDWKTFSSAKGSVLEVIKSGMEIPPGSIIFEDPPDHDVHRNLLRRIFSPRAITALEPKIRQFCAESLDPKVGSGGFDFIADLGAQMPMRTIGLLLGIPEKDQVAIREIIDDGLRMGADGEPMLKSSDAMAKQTAIFAEYIDWRAKHPSDDLMTQLLEAEYVDTDGTQKKLTREEVINYVNLLAAAGNETTTRLIGWLGKCLADNPDQRALLVENPRLIPGAIEETLRYEPPSPLQARYVMKETMRHGVTIPAGSAMLLLNAAANRDEEQFPDPDRYDVRRDTGGHLSFGYSIHFCLGASLARLEGRVGLEEVLKRFPTWELDTDNAKRAHTSTVRGWDSLPVFTK